MKKNRKRKIIENIKINEELINKNQKLKKKNKSSIKEIGDMMMWKNAIKRWEQKYTRKRRK